MKESYHKSATAVLQKINELASISEDRDGITRRFGSNAFMEAAQKVLQWMNEAGLQTRIDHIGNVRGRLLSPHPNAKTLVIASHIDTVVNAGRFDGPLGVLAGLEIITQLIQQKAALPFHIELIAFSDEEGVRFHTTYLGSKVVAGHFDNSLLNKHDDAGISLQKAVEHIGGHCDQLNADAIPANQWLGYYEIHIEQGPVLFEKNIPVGIVKAIAGQKRALLTFTGEAGHAGTVPMDMRQDALCAAAEFVLQLEQFAKMNAHLMVATVGKLEIAHAASNVIPGAVQCTLDVRSADAPLLSLLYQQIEQLGRDICERRRIMLQYELVQASAPVACNELMNQLLAQSVGEAGYEVVELVSGAGHDAVAIAAVAPVAMLFVKCYRGISHHPQEAVAEEDIAAAVEVSLNFINHLIQQYNSF